MALHYFVIKTAFRRYTICILSFITTGTFTRDAVKEATRDGAPPIDLVDGDQLADKLKELGLGIKTEMVEKISVDTEWFKAI